jgi:hypothetical protein
MFLAISSKSPHHTYNREMNANQLTCLVGWLVGQVFLERKFSLFFRCCCFQIDFITKRIKKRETKAKKYTLVD